MTPQTGARARGDSCLRIHVLDALRGGAAEGLRVEVFRLGQRAEKRCSGRVGAHGTLDDASLGADRLVAGEYEIVLHLGEYFHGRAREPEGAPRIEGIALRLRIDHSPHVYNLPLRISPAGIWAT